jgi:hypothetical protein
MRSSMSSCLSCGMFRPVRKTVGRSDTSVARHSRWTPRSAATTNQRLADTATASSKRLGGIKRAADRACCGQSSCVGLQVELRTLPAGESGCCDGVTAARDRLVVQRSGRKETHAPG